MEFLTREVRSIMGRERVQGAELLLAGNMEQGLLPWKSVASRDCKVRKQSALELQKEQGPITSVRRSYYPTIVLNQTRTQIG